MININWTNESEDCIKVICNYITLDKRSIVKKVLGEIYH